MKKLLLLRLLGITLLFSMAALQFNWQLALIWLVIFDLTYEAYEK